MLSELPPPLNTQNSENLKHPKATTPTMIKPTSKHSLVNLKGMLHSSMSSSRQATKQPNKD